MTRIQSVVLGIVCIYGCGDPIPGSSVDFADIVMSACPAVETLVQASASSCVLKVDFGLSSEILGEQFIEYLALDSCRKQVAAIRLPRTVKLEDDISVSEVSVCLGFDHDEDKGDHRPRVTVIVNQAGQILCEGHLIAADEIEDCYRSKFSTALSEDSGFGGMDVYWMGTHKSIIEEVVMGAVREHGSVLRAHVCQTLGKTLCALSVEEARGVRGAFVVRLLPGELPPPPLSVQVWNMD